MSKHLRIIVPCSCSNEFDDSAPSFAVWELTKEAASKLRSKIATFESLLFGRVMEDPYYATWWSFCNEYYVHPSAEDFELFSELTSGEQECGFLPEDQAIPEESIVRSECHMLHISAKDIWFTAISKHGSSSYDTIRVDRESLDELLKGVESE